MKKIFIMLATMMCALSVSAQKRFELPLYPEGMPDSNGITEPIFDKGGNRIGNITEPSIVVCLPEKTKATGRAVVICPGGGYALVSLDNEGFQPAEWFNELGIAAIVLKYRMPNKHHEIPLEDVQKVLTTTKQRAAEWNIDPAQVGIMGFSAGGHLAGSATTMFTDEVTRPAFSVLIYPVVTLTEKLTHWGTRTNLIGNGRQAELVEKYSIENNVTENTPPVFLALCSDDRSVPAQNSIMLYTALLEKGHKPEMHIFPDGGHGWGFNDSFAHKAELLSALKAWLGRLK